MILSINLFKFMLLILTMMMLMNMNNMFLMDYQMIIILNETFINFYSNLMLVFDMYSITYFMVISIVVFNVLSFMNMYMYMNYKMKTFFIMTKIFIMSMFLLVYSFNIWSMIVGWEGLGMSSFYLIFFYNNFESWKSAIKTFINNKMGDCLILISMIYLTLYNSGMKMISMTFMLAMLTKSAQYPFMAWLPMAMSAPTPISAMVHSSTLVTASLFIMMRFMNSFMNKFNVNMMMNLCLMSMFISGMKATSEKDMKKMIALSTLSQISLIFFFLLNNMKTLAFLYMCNHALFKSMLFINMGMMMLSNFSSQLSFNMNNSKMIFFYMLSYKISCFNLMNMMFFSSFFIKEKMMESLENNFSSHMKFTLFLINSFLTMNYTLKMILFFNMKNFKKKNNYISKNSKYNFSFFLMNLLSIMASKYTMSFYLSMNMLNNMIMMIYLMTLLMNYKIYKNKLLLFEKMNYLNFLMNILPLKFMEKNFDFNEYWMEKISFNSYFFLKSKTVSKSFYMNFNMIMMMIMLIMFM